MPGVRLDCEINMNIFQVGVAYWRENGIGCFWVRVIKWIPKYLEWKRAVIKGWLFNHIDAYRIHLQFKYLKKEDPFYKCIKFREIRDGIEWCESNGLAYEILNHGEKIEVVAPACFEERGETRHMFDSPPIYFTTFRDVDIYGATDLISSGEIAISDIYARDRGKNRYEIERGSIIYCSKKGKWMFVAYRDKGEIVEEAISCVGGACYNYFHFTFEILSRLVFIDDRYEEYRALPILVDQAALNIPQMRDLLERVNIYHHPIIPVEGCHRLHVKKLLYVSRNLWMPLDFKPETVTKAEDYMFSRSVADHIRKRVLGGDSKVGESAYKKIFISRRRCKVQRLSNSIEIEQIFSEHGYQIVFPEEMSFDEEVAVFHRADVIVGATGAAFTNIVFCHEGAKVGIILPSNNDIYFFSNIANMVNVEFIVLGADVVKKEGHISLDIFALNMDKCRRFISFIEG